MQKTIVKVIVLLFMILTIFMVKNVYAAEVIDNKTESQLIEMKQKEMKKLEDYEEVYGSKSYGFTAYILNRVQIISIPITILGIIIAAVYQYILGIRHLEVKEKGLILMITFITLGIICQVLPLVFTIIVKFGRE